jgi:hypothetical protein
MLSQPAFTAEMRGVSWDILGSKREARLPEKWKGIAKKAGDKANYNYFLPTGFTWNVRLQNTIYSLAQQSPVILVTERDIIYLDRVVIPAATRIIGAALVEQNGDRILVQFGVIVFPTGDEVPFSGMALSLDGSVGLAGRVERRKDSQVANRVLRALVTGTQAAVEATAANPITAQVTQGVGLEAAQELDADMQRVVAVDKSITVDAEVSVTVYLNRRLEY